MDGQPPIAAAGGLPELRFEFGCWGHRFAGDTVLGPPLVGGPPQMAGYMADDGVDGLSSDGGDSSGSFDSLLGTVVTVHEGSPGAWDGRVSAYDPVDDVFEVVDECGRSAYLHRDDLCPRMDDGSDWDDWDPDSIGAAELDMIQQQLEGGGTRPDALDARRGL